MALSAKNREGIQVYGWEIPNSEKRQDYFCRDCEESLSFVDAATRIKHFRHRVASVCEPEPETEEHLYYKRLIFESLRDLNDGTPHLEHWIGNKKADVYWERGGRFNIVFEVQCSNYDLKDYEEKIAAYAYKKNLIVIYAFVGDGFLREVRDNVYSLKEIEKRILIEKRYLDTVIGAYLDGERVSIPVFKNKFAKGQAGYCSNRFIISHRESNNMRLRDFLMTILDYTPKNRYLPVCAHTRTMHAKHEEKLVRYKVVCKDCGKFLSWLRDSEALSLGYSLERTLPPVISSLNT